MEQGEQLDPIGRLHVVNTEREHLDERVEDAPRLGFRDARHHLRYETLNAQGFNFSVNEQSAVRLDEGRRQWYVHFRLCALYDMCYNAEICE